MNTRKIFIENNSRTLNISNKVNGGGCGVSYKRNIKANKIH